MKIRQKISESVEKIRELTSANPRLGIVLGTGLGSLVKEIEVDTIINYGDIPHFQKSTVKEHKGNLVFGRYKGKEIVIMQGRMHYYEGYSMQDITYPVYVMKFLGVETLMLSNACGSVNPIIRKGSLMIIDDHINLLGDNPLIGVNDDTLGPRFPDMSAPYDKGLIELAEAIALDEKIKIYKGVFSAMTGPNLETRAEYRMLQIIGADVIGMSTIPECIVGNYLGLKVFGLSMVTDECYPDSLKKISIEEMVAAANASEPNFNKLVLKMIEKC